MGCISQKQAAYGSQLPKIKQLARRDPVENTADEPVFIPNENVIQQAVVESHNSSSNRSGRPQWITDFEKAKQNDIEYHKGQVNESKIDIVVSTTANGVDILPHKMDINELLKLPSIVQLEETQINKQKVARELFPKSHFEKQQTKFNTNPTQNQLFNTTQENIQKANRRFGIENNPKMAQITIKCRVVSINHQ